MARSRKRRRLGRLHALTRTLARRCDKPEKIGHAARVSWWNETRADGLAQTALGALARPYPFHLQHLLLDGDGTTLPHVLYPVFHGSYDWHSSVHMHATLASLLRWFPGRAWEQAALAHFHARITTERVAAERAYFAPSERRTFERPYGWAWLLRLQRELDLLGAQRPQAVRWADTLRPLTNDIVQRWLAFLPHQAWPVRAGVHGLFRRAVSSAVLRQDTPRARLRRDVHGYMRALCLS